MDFKNYRQRRNDGFVSLQKNDSQNYTITIRTFDRFTGNEVDPLQENYSLNNVIVEKNKLQILLEEITALINDSNAL